MSKPKLISRKLTDGTQEVLILQQKPVILFRNDCEAFGSSTNDEFLIAKKYFDVKEYRSDVPNGSLVIGRYSVLPYYRELEKELERHGSFMMTSYDSHRYIADIMNYYEDIKDFTPKTYTEWYDIPEGSYVVKGKTNSRKHEWNTKMFAPNKKALIETVRRLLDDSFIGEQGLVVREYVPLKQFDVGINGLPITNEWRMFFCGTNLLASGYYWSNFDEYAGTIDEKMIDFAKSVAKIVSEHITLFVIDVAEKADGGYIVIELNDFQMSGLSMCNTDELYKNLSAHFE